MNDNLTKPNAGAPEGTGLKPEIAVLLIYIFSWVGGIIFLLTEKKDRSVRFHAMQSIILGLGFTVVAIVSMAMIFIPLIGVLAGIFVKLLYVGVVAISVIICVKKFKNQDVRLPFIGDLADKLLSRMPEL